MSRALGFIFHSCSELSSSYFTESQLQGYRREWWVSAVCTTHQGTVPSTTSWVYTGREACILYQHLQRTGDPCQCYNGSSSQPLAEIQGKATWNWLIKNLILPRNRMNHWYCKIIYTVLWFMIILKLYGSMPIYAHSYTIYTYILEIICTAGFCFLYIIILRH